MDKQVPDKTDRNGFPLMFHQRLDLVDLKRYLDHWEEVEHPNSLAKVWVLLSVPVEMGRQQLLNCCLSRLVVHCWSQWQLMGGTQVQLDFLD